MQRASLLIRSAVLLVLIAPVIVYLWTFGWKLSQDHTRWGEFGSAMSGIYTPILTLLTLSVLIFQVRLQHEMHAYDQTQAYIEQARSDIEFYVGRLESVVTLKISTGNTVREVLHASFEPSDPQVLDSSKLRALAHMLNGEVPQLLGVLSAIQAILVGLAASQQAQYQLNYTSAVQKMIALLSFETCVAIENYHRTLTEGRLKGVKYVFSPLLSE
jgi:hypothetical protein